MKIGRGCGWVKEVVEGYGVILDEGEMDEVMQWRGVRWRCRRESGEEGEVRSVGGEVGEMIQK